MVREPVSWLRMMQEQGASHPSHTTTCDVSTPYLAKSSRRKLKEKEGGKKEGGGKEGANRRESEGLR